MWIKLIITLSLTISIVIHHVLFHCLYYRKCENNPFKRNDAFEVAKLLEIEKPKEEKRMLTRDRVKDIRVKKEVVNTISKDASPKSKSNPKLASKSEDRKEQVEESELIILGQNVLNSSSKGSFPPLSLDYDNPRTFLKGIYEMGGKTYLYDNLIKKLVGEVDLLNSSIKNRKDLPRHFSPFKRVIEDDWIDKYKEKVVNLYGGLKNDYQILLLIPEDLEAKWIGHQINLFRNYNLMTKEVAKVIANFGNKKMIVKQVILKNGEEIEVSDIGV